MNQDKNKQKTKEDKRAEALKANLMRRKEQKRDRNTPENTDSRG